MVQSGKYYLDMIFVEYDFCIWYMYMCVCFGIKYIYFLNKFHIYKKSFLTVPFFLIHTVEDDNDNNYNEVDENYIVW